MIEQHRFIQKLLILYAELYSISFKGMKPLGEGRSDQQSTTSPGDSDYSGVIQHMWKGTI